MVPMDPNARKFSGNYGGLDYKNVYDKLKKILGLCEINKTDTYRPL